MTFSINKGNNILTVIAAAFIFSIGIFGQTPIPPSAQGGAIQPPDIKPRAIPQRSLGLDSNNVVRWTLKDAILAALERNVDIQIERENVRLAEFDLSGSRGVYDPTFTSTMEFDPVRIANATPAAQTTTSSGTVIAAVGNTFTTNTLTMNFGINRQIEKTGASFSASFNNNRINSNRSTFDPQYSPSLSFSYTQPLMRNRKIDNNRRQIKLLKKQLDLSDSVFRQKAIQIIASVQQAYWNLAFALRDEEIQRDSVKLAETQLTNNQRQVEVGTLAPIDVVSAATTVETRRISVFTSMATVSQAENALKQLIAEGPDSEIWKARILPLETFEMQPIPLNIDDALKIARENRPELKQFALQKDINAANIEYFKDQTKPQIDFFAVYTPNGIAGDPSASTYITTTTNGVTTTRTIVDDRFNGGYFTGLKNMFTNKYSTARFGLTISVPWKNRTAEANLGRALETTKQIDLQVRKQVQDIETQIRNDLMSLEMTRLRVQAAQAGEEYARQQLLGEEKRFAAGLTTTFFVLQRQNDLAVAKGSLIRALTDYNIQVSLLQQHIGTTLSQNNIEVKSDAAPQGDVKK